MCVHEMTATGAVPILTTVTITEMTAYKVPLPASCKQGSRSLVPRVREGLKGSPGLWEPQISTLIHNQAWNNIRSRSQSIQLFDQWQEARRLMLRGVEGRT